MARKREVVITMSGTQGAGKTIILKKLCDYLEFFDIEIHLISEHSVSLKFNEDILRRLEKAR